MSAAGSTPTTLTSDEIVRVRMHALGLAPAAASNATRTNTTDRVVSVVNHLFALQGQDWRSSKWAIGVRSPGLTSHDIVAAFNERRIVRSWPMRGTVHLTQAEDIGWLQRLTNPRVLATAPKRRAFLGMSDAVLEHVTEVSLAALAGGNSLSRDELSTIWTEAGIDWQPSWRYHLIWWLAQNGLTTFGPIVEASPTASTAADPEPRLVLASEWIRNPRTLEGDEALLELATRYIRGRGAATQKDLASWAMLPAADVKRGLALAAESGAIEQAKREGATGAAAILWVDPAAVDGALTSTDVTSATSATWHVLPAFDEHLLGYTLRDPQLDPEHLPSIIPGKNGVFLATVVRNGRVVGTWRRDPKSSGASGTVLVSALPGARIDLPALQPEFERWATFYGLDSVSPKVT